MHRKHLVNRTCYQSVSYLAAPVADLTVCLPLCLAYSVYIVKEWGAFPRESSSPAPVNLDPPDAQNHQPGTPLAVQ